MATGIDINTSRRTNHSKCEYWKVNERNKDKSELIYEKKSDGVFYAKEISAFSKDIQYIGDVFAFQSNTITLVTSDNNDISINNIVRFNGKLWIVVNIQRRRIMKQTEFSKKTSHYTYIQLKG